MEIYWHNLKEKEVLERLDSKMAGLDLAEVRLRQKRYGANKLPSRPRLTALQILYNQLKNPLIIILFIGGCLSLFLQEYLDGIVIFAALIINSIIGFIQEYKAEQAITALQKMTAISAKVIREGKEILIGVSEIVPGDIIVLDEGDRVPADARLLQSHDLQVNEALLTGESFPSEKNVNSLPVGITLAERENMVYAGTVVLRGRGLAVVVETGKKTEMGKIAVSLKAVGEEPTPLQRQMTYLTKWLSVIIIFLTAAFFLVGLAQGRAAKEMCLAAIAVVVSTIPEGLPVAVTIILVIGMRRILKENALVRKIIAAETLGSVSVVCMDKTGTLTEGVMTVSEIWTMAGEKACKTASQSDSVFDLSGGKISALEVGVLCNNAVIEKPKLKGGIEQWEFLGDPLEAALLKSGIGLGIDRDLLNKNMPRIDEIPFSSERKYMATCHKLSRKENIIFIKGAPEKILEFTTKFKCDGSLKFLTEKDKKTILNKIDEFALRGERILALAYKTAGSSAVAGLNHNEGPLFDAVFIGFVSFKDPIRDDIKKVIEESLGAGVRPVIITGDYLKTAVTLAKEAGIKIEKGNVISGEDCKKFSDKEFFDCVKKVNVFARIEPNDKMRIIDALQKNGEVVAMVGDGVNDAPSLKAADIGISLGTGTDVTKEAADMVLLDNNFKTIISAIRQGRLIFENIRKAVTYALSDAFCEIILLAGAVLFHMPIPFFPAQILWVNIIEDALPNIALGFDKEEGDLLKEKPRSKREPILNAELKSLVFIVGIVTDVLLFGLFYYLLKTTNDLIYARTMVFAGLAIDSLFYIFAIRTLRQPMWRRNPFGNKLLTGAVIFGLAMIACGIYLPPLQTLLRTAPLALRDWLVLIPLGIINILLIELVKTVFFRRRDKRKFAFRKIAGV